MDLGQYLTELSTRERAHPEGPWAFRSGFFRSAWFIVHVSRKSFVRPSKKEYGLNPGRLSKHGGTRDPLTRDPEIRERHEGGVLRMRPVRLRWQGLT